MKTSIKIRSIIKNVIKPTCFVAVLCLVIALIWMGCNSKETSKITGYGKKAQPKDTPKDAAKTWNVILITLDTLRADYLGCYGHPDHLTPVLDEFAAEGIRFAQCNACTPITRPSHSTILTGLYPFIHGVQANGSTMLLDKWDTIAEILNRSGYGTHAIIASFVLDSLFNLDQGFDTYNDVPNRVQKNVYIAERRADEITELAEEILSDPGKKPFFLWLHYYDPHHPYISTNGYSEDSKEAYAEEVQYLDKYLGRVKAKIELEGLDKNSIVILVGDHGEGLGDHGELDHTKYVYQTTMHVPLIIWMPELLKGGKTVSARVRTVDIIPTILEYTGYEIPDDLSGVSLVPLLDGREKEDRIAYGESYSANITLGYCPLKTVIDRDWKYIHCSSPELYRLSSDPEEHTDVFNDNQDIAQEMERKLSGILSHPSDNKSQSQRANLNESEKHKLQALGYLADDDAIEDVASQPWKLINCISPMLHKDVVHQYCLAARYLGFDKKAKALPILMDIVDDVPDPKNIFPRIQNASSSEKSLDNYLYAQEKVLEKNPALHKIRLSYASKLYQNEQPQNALEQYKILAEKIPDAPIVFVEMAKIYWELDQLNHAHQNYSIAMRLDPEDHRIPYALALLSEQMENLDAALDYIRLAVKIGPDSAGYDEELERLEKLNR